MLVLVRKVGTAAWEGHQQQSSNTQIPISVSDSIDGSVIPVTPGPGEQTVEP